MDIDHPLAVSILTSYFLFIFFLLWRIRAELKKAIINLNSNIFLFILLAVISFIATWTYMFKFFIFSYQEWWMKQPHSQSLSIINSISHWLNDVSLFDSAWRKVSVGVWPWLWSHQLCSLTVSVWTPLLAIEGTRRNIPYVWAYMLLGQVVAISVASALFFVVMLTHTPIPSRQPSEKLLKSLSVSTIGGLITVILSPFVASTELFMPNLLIMHILLILPLIYKQHHQQQNNKPSYSITIFIMLIYTIAAGANLAIYVNQWFECLTTISLDTNSSIFIDIYHKVVNTFFSHPAQSSISYDIVCMQLISTAWMWVYSRSNFTEIPKWTYALMIITPLLSASVTLPLFIVGCEYQHLLLDNKKIS